MSLALKMKAAGACTLLALGAMDEVLAFNMLQDLNMQA